MLRLLRTIGNGVRALGRGRDLAGRVAALETRVRRDQARWVRRRVKWLDERAQLVRRKALLHREVPSKDALRELLPLRARTVAARASAARAAEYDARLQAISAPYREAIAALAQPRADLAATSLLGVTWWVPVPSSLKAAARDRFIAEQRFPFRTLTQTREFAGGPIMLDIGANIGRMSIPRVILGDFARAYCAEPDPLNYAALVRNVAANGLCGLVLPDQAAIGAATGRARLEQGKYPGSQRLVGADRPGETTIEVPCFTLDDWCRRLSIDPELVHYVKLDTQGWELYVLRGAMELLQHRHIAWQIEIAPDFLQAAGTPAQTLFEFCADQFTDFIDLDKTAVGPRVRRTHELAASLDYLIGRKAPTDVILFNRSS
jgi:FkbM family methyltransferase